MNTQLTIRPIESKDLLFVNRVRNTCKEFLHNQQEFSMQETIEWFVNKKPEWYMIDAQDVTLDGFALSRNSGTVGYIRTEKHGTGLQIGMDLDEQFRGKGLAKAAYKKFISWAFDKGHSYLTLDVLASNTRAYTLYRSLGFTVNYDSLPVEIERGRERILSITMDLTKEEWHERTA